MQRTGLACSDDKTKEEEEEEEEEEEGRMKERREADNHTRRSCNSTANRRDSNWKKHENQPITDSQQR